MQRHIQSPKTERLKCSSSYRGWANKIHIFIYYFYLYLTPYFWSHHRYNDVLTVMYIQYLEHFQTL